MEYVKRIRCLENYVVRNIPDDLFYVDRNGEKKVDITNPRYYYGTIPNNVIDEEGNEILDINGQPIPNTINIDIFLTQKFDDIGIFSDTFLNDTKSTMSEEEDDGNEGYCPQLLDMSLDESNVPYISYQGVPLSFECCNFEVVQIKGVFWDGEFCRIKNNTGGSTIGSTNPVGVNNNTVIS